jgi:hypothetical protein
MARVTDYECPMKLFFIEIQNFWAGQKNWVDKFWGIWGIFSRTLSTNFGTVSFLLINHYFYKKRSLYIHIRNIYLGLGFEFGP